MERREEQNPSSDCPFTVAAYVRPCRIAPQPMYPRVGVVRSMKDSVSSQRFSWTVPLVPWEVRLWVVVAMFQFQSLEPSLKRPVGLRKRSRISCS